MPIDDALAQLGPSIKYETPKPKGAITGFADGDFFKFPIADVKNNLSQDYLNFLKQSGYAPNLDSATELRIAKYPLKINKEVKEASKTAGISISGKANSYLASINHTDSRKLAETLGYRLPTAAIMYKLFIPYIKNLTESGDKDAKTMLKVMTDTRAEWLEDLILNKNKLKIGNIKTDITLPLQDNIFDRPDINEFGYPSQVKAQGEFRYWFPRDNERAVFRDSYSELVLNCSRSPSVSGDVLGVRLTKFFS